MIELTFLQKVGLRVLRNAHIPRHVGFIMDGNRRHAKKDNRDPTSGHRDGAQALKKCLLYCLELGVQVASFYAFSLQNFNRKPEQVNFLMTLAEEEFQQLSELNEDQALSKIILSNQVKIVVIGDLEGQLKKEYPKVYECFKKLEEKTKGFTRLTLNLCFAYDSIFQISQAEKVAIEQKGNDSKAKVKKKDVFENLLIADQIDLLIRTSNEFRLSNFMLMQCEYAMIEIEKKYWPDFNALTMMKIILKYNYHYKQIQFNRARSSLQA